MNNDGYERDKEARDERSRGENRGLCKGLGG